MSFVAVSLVETGLVTEVAEVVSGTVTGSSTVAIEVVGSVGTVVFGLLDSKPKFIFDNSSRILSSITPLS